MANPKNTAELAALKEKFAEADSIVLTEYRGLTAVSYTHLRAHETAANLVCRLLLEKMMRKF